MLYKQNVVGISLISHVHYIFKTYVQVTELESTECILQQNCNTSSELQEK
jgi:hypothetical protein